MHTDKLRPAWKWLGATGDWSNYYKSALAGITLLGNVKYKETLPSNSWKISIYIAHVHGFVLTIVLSAAIHVLTFLYSISE